MPTTASVAVTGSLSTHPLWVRALLTFPKDPGAAELVLTPSACIPVPLWHRELWDMRRKGFSARSQAQIIPEQLWGPLVTYVLVSAELFCRA